MSQPQHAAKVASHTHEDPGEQARLAMFAIWQVKDQNTAWYFGVAMVGLVIIFTIAHWLQLLFNKRVSKSNALSRYVRAIAHPLRRINKATVLGGIMLQPGITILAIFYFGINAGLVFYDHPEKVALTILAKRFGWLSLCNLCLVIFLSLKNTPLSILAGRSFDRVNALHRCCGFLTILFMILHSTTYVYGLSTFGVMEQVLTEPQQYAGAVAALSMLLMLATAIGFVRRRQYELFYAVHIVMAAVVLVAVGLHRPDVSKKALIITIISASMWFADKSLRLSRWIYHGAGNHCILTPLSENATRVTMHRSMTAQLGSMAFLWIPGVQLLQRHPFTLISTQPAEFVIQAQDGFTKALHRAACKNPGGKFRAAIEGPYCVVPNTLGYDKVVLIAGGTGATFTIAMALDWARRYRKSKQRSTLDFVWIVRNRACLEWLDVELAELRARLGVSVSLYVSGATTSAGTREKAGSTSMVQSSKGSANSLSSVHLPSTPDHDHEQMAYETPEQPAPVPGLESFQSGRPDLPSLVQHAVNGLAVNDRVLVTGCGSSSLLHHVRQAVDGCRVASAPSVKVHLEQFSF